MWNNFNQKSYQKLCPAKKVALKYFLASNTVRFKIFFFIKLIEIVTNRKIKFEKFIHNPLLLDPLLSLMIFFDSCCYDTLKNQFKFRF